MVDSTSAEYPVDDVFEQCSSSRLMFGAKRGINDAWSVRKDEIISIAWKNLTLNCYFVVIYECFAKDNNTFWSNVHDAFENN